MGELERYGLLALASLTVLFLVLTFVRRDPEPRELAPVRLDAEAAAASPEWSGKVVNAGTRPPAPRVVPVKRLTEGAPPSTRPTSHVVRRGETLGQLAKRYLGESRRWPELVAENAPLDPRALQVGQKLRIPAFKSPARPEPEPEPERQPQRSASQEEPIRKKTSPVLLPTASEHLVRQGDTLSSISNRYYGSHMQWKRIYVANREQIPDARRLEVGTILQLP